MARRLGFLLEIGTEEIPDWMIQGALDHLRARFTELLEANRLGGAVDWVDATPRRLVLAAKGLAAGQSDSVELVTGPPRSAGEGAAQGFARRQGVAMEDLEIVSTPKGEYVAYRRRIAGRTARDILSEELPALILGIPWPKTMYWLGKGSPRFIRPIRWVVALVGGEVAQFEAAGVASGAFSSGHRHFGRKRIRVSPARYVEQLRAQHVLVRSGERRERIAQGIRSLLDGKDLRVKPDAALADTLTFLTEWPTPILGSFDEAYLSLPEEVLVTVMRHHQKYFSVERADGSLAPHFIAVMNAPGDPAGHVVAGNERVLRARFNDARFFWNVDQQKPLADRVASLAHVTFQARLGSYFDKTHRVVALVGQLNGGPEAERAALLAKCDLTTEMVKEFTELQGVVGGLYARAQGEPEAVARAIYEHYRPASMDDAIPSTRAGQAVALADKLDTLRECFRIDLIPSGSRDPFALRRAAQGVVRILVEGGWETPLAPLLGGDRRLEDFFADRVRYYFRDVCGFAYDEVNAVMAAGWDNLPDTARRLKALQRIRPTGDFLAVAAAFKRIRNILKQAGCESAGAVDEALLEPGPEADLAAAARCVAQAADAWRRAGDYGAALGEISSLRPHVDLFFDKVLVNAPDEAVRTNRLALLSGILLDFSSIADFSEIVTSSTPTIPTNSLPS